MDGILAIVITVGGVASAILAIWALMERVSSRFSRTVDDKIKQATREIKEGYDRELRITIEARKAELDSKLEVVNTKINDLGTGLSNNDKEQQALIEKQSKAILEGYKHDIRKVYYRLRSSGAISDVDKAYVDKIYHHYRELGGNSDIEAKYKEMCEVYSRRTHEAYDKKAKKRHTQ